MKINDARHLNKPVLFDECVTGQVYIDVMGNYLLCPDMENTMICLVDGTVYSRECYDPVDVFLPINARLEIE